jgi:hypothetical protein
MDAPYMELLCYPTCLYLSNKEGLPALTRIFTHNPLRIGSQKMQIGFYVLKDKNRTAKPDGSRGCDL